MVEWLFKKRLFQVAYPPTENLKQGKSKIKMGNVPRVFGAVGARCLHLSVLSINSSLSLASEYFSRSSMF